MSLLAWYKLNDSNIYNSAPASYKVISKGSGATLTSNGTYSFDGTSNAFIQVDNMHDKLQKHSFSVSAWFKTPGYGTGNNRITIYADSNGSKIFIENSGALTFFIYTNTIDGSSTLTGVEAYKAFKYYDNLWHHVVGIHDEENKTITLKVDGKTVATTTYPSNYYYYGDNSKFYLGWNPNSPTTSGFNGEIKDVRVWDEVISDKVVYELSKGLQGLYRFNRPFEPYNNMLKDNLAVWTYNNYGSSKGLTSTVTTLLNETFKCGAIYRLQFVVASDVDSAALSNLNNELWATGILFRYNNNSSILFSANTKYNFTVYYRPITHKLHMRVGGTVSNINGWTEISPKQINDEWYSVGQYRDGSVTTDKTDGIYTSFYNPDIKPGETVIIDFACPVLTQSPIINPATFTRNSPATDDSGNAVLSNIPRINSNRLKIEEGTTNYWTGSNIISTDRNGTITNNSSVSISQINSTGTNIISTTTGANTYIIFFGNTTNVIPNTQICTISAYVVNNNNFNLSMYHPNDSYSAHKVIIPANSQGYFSFYTVGGTSANGGSLSYAARPFIEFSATANQTTINVTVANIMAEYKSYPTSFTSGTRATEQLTVPYRVLNRDMFTISIRASLNVLGVRKTCIFDARNSALKIMLNILSNNVLNIEYLDTSSTVHNLATSYTLSDNSIHAYTLTYKLSTGLLCAYADGVPVYSNTITDIQQITNPSTDINIGCSSGVGEELDGYITAICISNTDHSASKIASDVKSSFTVESDTTFLSNIASSLSINNVAPLLSITEFDIYNYNNKDTVPCYDLSGFNNDGSIDIATSPIFVKDDTAPNGGYALFNGGSDPMYINLGKSHYNITEQISVAALVYYDGSNSLFNGRIISCTESGGFNFEPNHFVIFTTNANSYLIADVPSSYTSSIGWHLLVGTFDGYTAKIYIDGALQGSSKTLSTIDTIHYNSNASLYIGAEAGVGNIDSIPIGFRNGRTAEIRIYSRALIADDIKRLYELYFHIDNKQNIHSDNFIENPVQNLVYSGDFSKSDMNIYTSRGNSSIVQNDTYKNILKTTNAGDMFLNSLDYANNLIPVNSDDILETSFNIRIDSQSVNNSSIFFCIRQIDSELQYISSSRTYFTPNTLTTLSQDLKSGDTVAHLTSTANWNSSSISTVGILDDFIYGNLRTTKVLDISSISGNDITLKTAYNDTTIPAGTSIVNALYSATYYYPIAGIVGNNLTLGNWYHYSGRYSINSEGKNRELFTQFMLVGFLTFDFNLSISDVIIKNISRPQVLKLPPTNSTQQLNSSFMKNKLLKTESEFISCGMNIRYIKDTINGNTVDTNNNWNTVKAINEVGNNVAYHKKSSIDGINYIYRCTASEDTKLIDPITNNNWVNGLAIPSSLITDLGFITNISYLNIFHLDPTDSSQSVRIYHNHKVEVSADGTNWVTVYDSDITGEITVAQEANLNIYLIPNKTEILRSGPIYTPKLIET